MNKDINEDEFEIPYFHPMYMRMTMIKIDGTSHVEEELKREEQNG